MYPSARECFLRVDLARRVAQAYSAQQPQASILRLTRAPAHRFEFTAVDCSSLPDRCDDPSDDRGRGFIPYITERSEQPGSPANLRISRILADGYKAKPASTDRGF